MAGTPSRHLMSTLAAGRQHAPPNSPGHAATATAPAPLPLPRLSRSLRADAAPRLKSLERALLRVFPFFAMVCTCGSCAGGVLSPRMAIRLQGAADTASSLIDETITAHFAGEMGGQ